MCTKLYSPQESLHYFVRDLPLTLRKSFPLFISVFLFFSVLPSPLSEHPPTCPPGQRLLAGSPWWFRPAAPDPATGEGP